MAALGWLLSLAQKQSEASGEEQVKRMRTAAEKTPADPRSSLGLVLSLPAAQ